MSMTIHQQMSALVDIEVILVKSLRQIKLLNINPTNSLKETHHCFEAVKIESEKLDSYAGSCVIARIERLFAEDAIQAILNS